MKRDLPRQKRRHARDTVEESSRFVYVPVRSRRVKVTSHSTNKKKNTKSFTLNIHVCDCKLGSLFTNYNLDIHCGMRTVPLTVC